MRRLLWCVLGALLLASSADAAYLDPTVSRIEASQSAPGTVVVAFTFTGNAGEKPVTIEYTINGGSTAAGVQDWIFRQKAALNTANTVAKLPALQVGQTVPGVQATTPAQTAFDIWRAKAQRLVRLKALVAAGVSNGTLAGEITTLTNDVNATYVAGYADSL